jgi:uncharacterized protein
VRAILSPHPTRHHVTLQPSDATDVQGKTPVSAHEETIQTFYEAFQRRDHSAMGACYHTDIHFSDPVFEDLRGDEARAMWHMLCEQGADLEVTFRDVEVEGDHGSAHWEAAYTFTPTQRKVLNRIDASFTFVDGKIIRHADSFDLWRWMRMAIGMSGVLVGWSGSAQNKVRTTGRAGLDKFLDAHPEYHRP